MLVTDLFSYANIHFERYRDSAYGELHNYYNTDVGKIHLMLNSVDNKLQLAQTLADKYEDYIDVIKLAIDCSLKLFTDAKIAFRLYDINSFLDSSGMIVLGWNIDNKEYNFVIVGNVNYGPYYKIGANDGEHVVLGSIAKEFEFDNPLPVWFIDAMKTGYC
jgi:hypothetical protein